MSSTYLGGESCPTAAWKGQMDVAGFDVLTPLHTVGLDFLFFLKIDHGAK